MSEILSILQKDKRAASQRTSELGIYGETLAVVHLIRAGYRIVLTNFKVPVGRNSKGVQVTGEIDIIALDIETLCFVEVKARRSDDFAPVISAVDTRKQRQITRTSKIYRRLFGVRDIQYRFDVVTVLVRNHAEPEIELTKGFWNPSKFRKRRWELPIWNDFQ
ncbi:MAG TPA: YraN family protein [Pyrinomonadaceae bacterium]|nr:YraN family protein [Acidobacteriota bacterium]HQZ95783.1 YraN family protein [Pyrinomonadaceae bacterium]